MVMEKKKFLVVVYGHVKIFYYGNIFGGALIFVMVGHCFFLFFFFLFFFFWWGIDLLAHDFWW